MIEGEWGVRQIMIASPPNGRDANDCYRHVRLDHASNLRDFGGYPSRHGGRVRRQLLYRSGAMPFFGKAELEWITDRAVRTVVDLRSESEREIAPTSWRGLADTAFIEARYDATLIFRDRDPDPAAPIALNALHQSLYATLAEILAPSLYQLMQSLLTNAVPVIIHCSAGQDRTGLTVALVLDLLGVDRHLIMEDYLLSTAARRPANELDRKLLMQLADRNTVARFYAKLFEQNGNEILRPRPLVGEHGQPLLELAFAAIEQNWGSTADYCRDALSVGAAEIEQLCNLYLEPNG